MEGFHPLLLLELFVFGGAALAWGIWELWQTERAIRRAKEGVSDPPAVADSGASGHAEGEHELDDGRS